MSSYSGTRIPPAYVSMRHFAPRTTFAKPQSLPALTDPVTFAPTGNTCVITTSTEDMFRNFRPAGPGVSSCSG